MHEPSYAPQTLPPIRKEHRNKSFSFVYIHEQHQVDESVRHGIPYCISKEYIYTQFIRLSIDNIRTIENTFSAIHSCGCKNN